MRAIRVAQFTPGAHPFALPTIADGAWVCRGAPIPTGQICRESYSRYPKHLRLAIRFGKVECLRTRPGRQTLSVALGVH